MIIVRRGIVRRKNVLLEIEEDSVLRGNCPGEVFEGESVQRETVRFPVCMHAFMLVIHKDYTSDNDFPNLKQKFD